MISPLIGGSALCRTAGAQLAGSPEPDPALLQTIARVGLQSRNPAEGLRQVSEAEASQRDGGDDHVRFGYPEQELHTGGVLKHRRQHLKSDF